MSRSWAVMASEVEVVAVEEARRVEVAVEMVEVAVERRGSSAVSVPPMAATSAAMGSTCSSRTSLRSERREDSVKVV
eukprot:6482859-Prorocentrum_lima.AAC.1